MIFAATKFLGLALRERSILAAEIRVAGEQKEALRMAEFVFPSDLSWEKPQLLGTALRRFLRQHSFSAARAVIGVPAKWLMARSKEVPPASEEVAASALRLQAERDFPPELKELVFDYAGQADPGKAQKVLVVAMVKQHLDRLTAMADEAGLSVTAVTSSSLALASAGGANWMSLVLETDAAELALRGEGAPRMLKYLPVSGLSRTASNGHAAAAVSTLRSEVQRAISTVGHGGKPDRLFLWDGVGLDAEVREALSEQMGLKVQAGEAGVLGLSVPEQRKGEAGRFGVPLALALAGAGQLGLSIDFLHSRLAAPKKNRLDRKTLWGGGGVVALVIVAAFLIWDNRRSQAELDRLKEHFERIRPAVTAAKKVDEKVTFAGNWFGNRPPYMGCLREVTLAFPSDSSLWATAFSLREEQKREDHRGAAREEKPKGESYKGLLTGKATDMKAVLGVLDRLKGNANFADVKSGETREAGGRSRDVTFSLTFTYKGKE